LRVKKTRKSQTTSKSSWGSSLNSKLLEELGESSCDKVPKNVEIPPDKAQMIKAIEVERLKKEITDEISKRETETPPLRT